MSWSSRRASVIVAVIILLGTFTSLNVAAQKARLGVRKQPLPPGGRPTPPPPKSASGDPTDLGGVTVTADESEQAQLAGRIKAAQDNIDVGDWKKAIEILQNLLEREEDAFVPVTRTIEGRTVKIITSIRAEANRLVGNLPAKAMEVYKLTYGSRADELLKLAKEGDDVRLLAEIMSRYLYTEAGGEATDLLATRLLDRGQYATAALCFEKLIQRQGPDKLSVNTLFRATLAFQQSKDKANLAKAWKFIEGKTDTIKLGNGKKLEVGKMKTWVASRSTGGSGSTRFDWQMVGGNPSRSAQGFGGTAFLEPRWKFNTWRKDTLDTKSHLDKAVEGLAFRKAPLVHGFGPLAVTVNREDGKAPLMVYRDFWGIHARPLRNVGDPKSEEFCKAGDIYWESPSKWSMDKMLREPKFAGTLKGWIQTYLSNGNVQNMLRPEALFENSVVGSLSSDNVRVYAVDDFQVTPYIPPYNRFNRPSDPGGELNDAVNHFNILQAYDLDTGKLLWEAGGREDDKNKHELHDTFFLGPPLPLSGKLYVLGEKNQELRLISLDPATGQLLTRPQRLADAREKIQTDNARRFHASYLAYGEGILVCPTNAGGLLGVDLLTNSLVWAYGYREKGFVTAQQSDPRFGPPPPGKIYLPNGQLIDAAPITSSWKNTPPVISQGKVVFTAPDASSVHCLNLRDGSRLWKQLRQEGDVYLAGVFAGHVVIVGKQYVRGLGLADGVELWRVETGMPSGFGIASKDVYYLPLASAVKTREPEICLIDIKAGRVLAHTHSRKKEVPGNLLFYEGDVLSQSLFQVADYPQLDVELRRVDDLLAKNENDAEGRALRGDLRLDKGDLKGAIEDLRVALAGTDKKLPAEMEAKARTKLYESLTEYFQADFDAAEKYLKEYEAMCSVKPTDASDAAKARARAEEKKRKGNFWCLVGRGREKQALREEGDLAQKRLLQAFEAYMNFGALGESAQELMGVVGDPGVRVSPAVWSKGRISAMVASASAEKRKPLEKLIQARYDAVKKEKSLEALRGFVNTFGSISAVGREARLELAERLIALDGKDEDGNKTGEVKKQFDQLPPSPLVDAERHLSLLRLQTEDRQMAGRAVEALARLMTRKGLMDDATHYYQVLGHDFADVVIKDGKTGRDLYNRLATDKRLLLFLGGMTPLPDVKLKMVNVQAERGSFGWNNPLFQLEQEGERLPYFRRYAVAIRTDSLGQLKVIDREKMDEPQAEGELSATLNDVNVSYIFQLLQQQTRFGMQHSPARMSFKNLGHLIIVSVGHKVFAFDPVNKKKLWDKNLSGSTGNVNPSSVTVDPRDGSLLLAYAGGWTRRLAQPGPVSPAAVCLVTADGLVAVDPVDGHVLWTRNDLPKRCQLVSDAEHVYVVEVGPDGNAGTGRVFRLADGGDVRVKDFSAAYQKRAPGDSMLGRTILYSDSDVGKGFVLHLYDILAGKDRWTQEFPIGTKVLHSETEGIGGVVEPDGKVTVVDLKKSAVVYSGKLDKVTEIDLPKLTSIHLLSDRHAFYIVCNGPPDNKVVGGSLTSNLMPNTGLRALPVNGRVYSLAYSRTDGERYQWHNDVSNQMIVLDEFGELPMVLMTSRYRTWLNGNPGFGQTYVTATRVFDKQTGKLIHKDDESPSRNQQFHSLILKPSVGRVELRSAQLKLVFDLYARGGAKDAEQGKKQSRLPSPRGSRPLGMARPGAFPGFQPVQPAPAFQRQFAQPLNLTK